MKKSEPKKTSITKKVKKTSVSKKSQPKKVSITKKVKKPSMSKKSQPKKVSITKKVKKTSISKKSQPQKIRLSKKEDKVVCGGLAQKMYIKDGKLIKEEKELPLSQIHKIATLKSKYWLNDDFACSAGIRSDEGWIKSPENEMLRKEILSEINAVDPDYIKHELSDEEVKFENIVILCKYLKGIKYPSEKNDDIKTISDVKQFLAFH